MSRKRIVKRSAYTTEFVNTTANMQVRDRKSSFTKPTVDKKGKTPQLFQIPNNFSLWIAIFIAIIMIVLIIAGQSASPSSQTPVTLQLPSQQSKPLAPEQGGIKLNTLPGVNQLPSIKPR